MCDRIVENTCQENSDSLQTMLASQAVLQRDWDRSEEDAAWASL